MTSAKAQIILGEMQEVEILEAVWDAEIARGRRDDGLFRYNGQLVLASTWPDGAARPVRITPVKLRYHLGQIADWYRLTPRTLICRTSELPRLDFKAVEMELDGGRQRPGL